MYFFWTFKISIIYLFYGDLLKQLFGIKGDGFCFGLSDCEWWAERHGRLLLFLKSNKKWAASAAQTEINNDERGI